MTTRAPARVLVVDDEPELLELLADALAAADVEIRTASSGRQAIDLAGRDRPDLVVADLYLGDCSGLDVIDRLRTDDEEIPAVVITGRSDPAAFSEALRRRPIELMTKPLDLQRLRETVRGELARQEQRRRTHRRAKRLRSLARARNIERKDIHRRLDHTCANLTSAYRTLSSQFHAHEVILDYQRELLSARSDHDVFRMLFRLFVDRSGPIFGVSLVCDADAALQIVGRFGVPQPDGPGFCNALARPVIDSLLAEPHCTLLDAGEKRDAFDPGIRRYLVGVTVLAVPLIPEPGELIGVVVLYRKGEQPFHDSDVALANMIAHPTALTIRRND